MKIKKLNHLVAMLMLLTTTGVLAADTVRDGIKPVQAQHFLPPDLYLPESV